MPQPRREPPSSHPSAIAGLLVAVAVLAAALLSWSSPAAAASSTWVVSPSGSDTAAGTAEAPFRTLARALPVLQPGDTLLVRSGTYAERLRNPSIRPGRADAPVRVAAWPGERPVVEGLLWLKGASYWTVQGLGITWSAANVASEHLVKMTDGVGWSLVDNEIWGARSYAGVLVASTIAGEPAGWRIGGNCIHDTYASNSINQDHLIYANTGLASGGGLIDRNLLFNATNGEGVKIGGASATSGGSSLVRVQNNTIWNTSQNVLIAWQSWGNEVVGNLMGLTGPTYGNVRGYQLTGAGNVAAGNVGGFARSLLLNDGGYVGVADAGNTFGIDPRFDDTSSCAGFHPQDPTAAAVGRHAAGDAAPVPVPAPAPSRPAAPASPAPAAAPAPTPAGSGYRLVASDGGIFAFGDAGFFGSTGAMRLNKPIVGMASTPSGQGYWLVASDGGIFAFGDAGFFGSTGAMRLNKPIVAMTASPTGEGYWLVASDGGIFAFGDAGFFGSTGAIRLNKPIQAMTASRSGQGYWLVASDGGIFSFGDASFEGSTGGSRLPGEIVGMATAPDGAGYWLAGRDGSVYAFGSAADQGSAARPSAPIVGIAAEGAGYWLTGRDGALYAFGAAPHLGSMAGSALGSPVVGLDGVR